MQTSSDRDRPRSTASLFGHPIHPLLVPFPVVCFIGAFVTDIAYTRSYNLQWQYFSIWLLAAGLLVGGLAAMVGFIDYFGDSRVRRARPANWHMGINLLAWVLSLINAFVHSRDGWTAVVPEGLILSGIVVLLLLVSGWLGQSLVYRHGVGVEE